MLRFRPGPRPYWRRARDHQDHAKGGLRPVLTIAPRDARWKVGRDGKMGVQAEQKNMAPASIVELYGATHFVRRLRGERPRVRRGSIGFKRGGAQCSSGNGATYANQAQIEEIKQAR